MVDERWSDNSACHNCAWLEYDGDFICCKKDSVIEPVLVMKCGDADYERSNEDRKNIVRKNRDE